MAELPADRPVFDRTASERRLARTYAGPDNWDRVGEYRRAMKWRAQHPQRGSYAASRALDLPRGRIRTWFEGGKPDPVHAIATAESKGWLDAAPGEPCFEGLSVLHAWVLSGGSISSDTFVPSCAVGPSDPAALAREAFGAVGVPTRSVNGASATRAREIRPKGQGGSHLGRFLHGVLRAPVGDKTEMGAEPLSYLRSVPKTTLLRWCQTYVTLRGIPIDVAGDRELIRLGEKRSGEYQRALAGLLREVVGDDAGITVTQRSVLLGADTVGMLDRVPTLPDA